MYVRDLKQNIHSYAGTPEDPDFPRLFVYERPLWWEYLEWQKHCFILREMMRVSHDFPCNLGKSTPGRGVFVLLLNYL